MKMLEKYLGPAIAAIAMLVFFASMYSSGCGYKSVKASAPGQATAANSFEDYSYKTLLDAQAGLNATRNEIQAGTLPQSLVPIFDRAVVVYNECIALEKRYDKVLRSGGDPATVQQELASNLGSLVGLIAQIRPPKTPAPAPATKQ